MSNDEGQGVFAGDPPEVLVLGGGVSGIAAAIEAAERGLRVTLIERKPFLGGRAYSFEDRVSGRELDNGQHVLIAGYRNFRRLLEQLGSANKIEFQPRLEIRYRDASGVETSLRAGPGPAPLHLGAALLGFSGFGWREKLSMIRPALALMIASDVSGSNAEAATAELTLDALLTRFGQSPRVREVFWEALSLATLNGAPEHVSALSMARVLNAGFAGHAPSASMGLPKAGLSDIIGRPAKARLERLGVTLMCRRSVTAIEPLPGSASARWRVALGQGEALEARHVISALEPHVLAKLLPEAMVEADPTLSRLEEIKYSPIVSAHALFERPVTLPTTFMALLGGQTQWVFDAAALQGMRGAGHLSLTISGADDAAAMPKAALHEMLSEELTRYLPELRDAGPARIVSVKEKRATILPSPEIEAARPGPRLGDGHRGLLLAGAWTQTGFPSTLEGAAMSGYRAIEALLEDLGQPTQVAQALDTRSWLVRSLTRGLRHLDRLAPGFVLGERRHAEL